MEYYSFSELKKKCVINVADGKKLGKICDVIFALPQNCVKGFIVENGPFSLCGERVSFSVCNIQKIGADAILVKLEEKCGASSKKQKCFKSDKENEVGKSEFNIKGAVDFEIDEQDE